MIYLDNAATTGRKPETVIEAVNSAMKDLCVNPGRGSYDLARKASSLIDETRINILDLARLSKGYHVVFSPSATIAFNQIILGMKYDEWTNIYVSPFEHNAVMRPLHAISEKYGNNIYQIPFHKDNWSVDEKRLISLFLENKPDYVFLSMVSNTTGFRLPIKNIIELAKKYGAKVVVDCAQAFGSINVDFSDIGADAYVFAGHKTLYGPYGIAGIIIDENWPFDSGILGGTGTDSLSLKMPGIYDGGWEAGSMNIPAIAGLDAAVKWAKQINPSVIENHELQLIRHVVKTFLEHPEIKLYIPPDCAISNIIAFNVEGYNCRDVGEILNDEFDIAVRTGYQCAPLVHDWLNTKQFGGIVRASVSWYNSLEDVDTLVNAVVSLLR